MTRPSLCILSVIYYEPQWLDTIKCVGDCRIPVHLVDRSGYLGLADAINRGMKDNDIAAQYDYVWIVTNPIWKPGLHNVLMEPFLADERWAAVSPAFNSDHAHMQKASGSECREVPFVEFTCPVVKADLLAQTPLDEEMPYVGHDLDWCAIMRKEGWKVGVYDKALVSHSYVRKMEKQFPHPMTEIRSRKRNESVQSTVARLESKWGKDWRSILHYHGAM